MDSDLLYQFAILGTKYAHIFIRHGFQVCIFFHTL